MNCATKSRKRRILVWVIWLLVVLACISTRGVARATLSPEPPLSGLALHTGAEERRWLFPWQPRWRWKKHALRRYRAWRETYRRARRTARLARLAWYGLMPMAWLVDRLTARQLRYQLGALPMLYALLETLKVRQIINRHCATRAQVDHGTVALVLILNRLMFPLPLYQVADWVGQTVLVAVLGVEAAKFNDDRLERTLDALAPHLEAIWLEVVGVALRKADIDLSLIFYDLTAFITHGRYADSELVVFGFAHNTPSNKRKFKLGLDTLADGNIPGLYRLWSGRTADQATVQQNMQNLARWLQGHGWPLHKTLVVGDRAMLNAEIAVTYDQVGLRYLAGLRCTQKEHKPLLLAWDDAQFEACPIVPGDAPQYWGRGCMVTFEHEGRTVTHKGLVVLAGPIRDQLRQARREQLQALEAELAQVRDVIGQPRLRTVKAVQRRVNGCLRRSKVGRLMEVSVYETPAAQVHLTWRVNETALAQAERKDGRYLLVTNDWHLSHQEMFRLYREKDGGEKRFTISKSDLQVSPVYLHQDQRIAAMTLLNMLALLAYSLLERQVRRQGLALTTRQLIRRLENLTLIETHCWDGTCLRRITPPMPECLVILRLVAAALDELVDSVLPEPGPMALPPPSPLGLPWHC
ncbi:MAG: IS1634 family transposase [Chloroflexi bacterium]|nr:MAG: IS1634 family transposase [Chloroflexota bacterium]